MADPVFDEDNILHMLAAPLTVEMIDYIQNAAAQALCDLYDRKVTRGEFVDLAGPCLALYAQSGKLRLMASIDETYKAGKIDQQQLDIAKSSITELLSKQRDTVVDIVKRLAQCSTSEDTVH